MSALPHYYSVVSIVKGRDWIAFLDPIKGLLVGEENDERKEFVQELWINVADDEAQIPFDRGHVRASLKKQEEPDRTLVELAQAVLPRLDHLVFFHYRSLADRILHEAKEWTMETCCPDRDPFWADVFFPEISKEYLEQLEPDARRANPFATKEWDEYLFRWLDELTDPSFYVEMEDVEHDAYYSRRGSIRFFVDPSLPPRNDVESTVGRRLHFAVPASPGPPRDEAFRSRLSHPRVPSHPACRDGSGASAVPFQRQRLLRIRPEGSVAVRRIP